ncbi:MAG: hypothetical protein ACJAQ3_000883 [Planctomycetota bacterium]|jgi:hypothetical protein
MAEFFLSLVRVTPARLGLRVAGLGILGGLLLSGAGAQAAQAGGAAPPATAGTAEEGKGQQPGKPAEKAEKDKEKPAEVKKSSASKDAKRLASTLRQLAEKLEAGEMDTSTAFRRVDMIQTVWTDSGGKARQAAKEAAGASPGGGKAKVQPKGKPGAGKAAPARQRKAAAQKEVPARTPAEAAAGKLPVFGLYDAEQVRLDGRVASGELTRVQANAHLAAFSRQLAIRSGRLPANPTAEDMPRYKNRKASLDRQVAAGKLTTDRRDLQLRVFRKMIARELAAENAAAPKDVSKKAPAAKPAAKRPAVPKGKAPARKKRGGASGR